MLVQLVEERERRKAKSEYDKNVGIISDYEDICTVIDELVDRVKASEFEFKGKFIQDLKDWKFDVVTEMQSCEDENLEIMEVWEEAEC